MSTKNYTYTVTLSIHEEGNGKSIDNVIDSGKVKAPDSQGAFTAAFDQLIKKHT